MQRTPEPELMDQDEQARAYAAADFTEPHQQFVEYCRQHLAADTTGMALDLGCGPADISLRFASAFTDCIVHGLDGAEAMLALGRQAVVQAGLAHRVELYQGLIQDSDMPLKDYDVIISNSLLHHIHRPDEFWQAVKRYSHAQTQIVIMDLMRPASEAIAKDLVAMHAKHEPEILQRDFYHSLKAAFTPDEIRRQLITANLTGLIVEVVSDRHLLIYNKYR